jgi:hypothetical protein
MSLLLKTVYSMLTGALGALFAWFVLDVLLQIQPASPFADALLNGAVVGVCVGVAVNGFNGLMEFQLLPLVKGVVIGFTAGLLGGAFGLALGELLYSLSGGSNLVRVLGWMVFGLSLGLADGILALSLRRILFAGLGGLLGGLLGGIFFSLLSSLSDLPFTSRALAFAILGGSVGLFVGLVPSALKDAWLKVVTSGRNEGKERIVDKPRLVIGSSTASDFSLYGDARIASRHAEILREGSQYILRPVGDAPVVVKDQRIHRYPLENEDTFQLGGETIIFRRKVK